MHCTHGPRIAVADTQDTVARTASHRPRILRSTT